jgi:hypothetical protein
VPELATLKPGAGQPPLEGASVGYPLLALASEAVAVPQRAAHALAARGAPGSGAQGAGGGGTHLTAVDASLSAPAPVQTENAALRQRVAELERLVGQLKVPPLADDDAGPLTPSAPDDSG